MRFVDGKLVDVKLCHGKWGDSGDSSIIRGSCVTLHHILCTKTHRIGYALVECSDKGERIDLPSENGVFCATAYLDAIHSGQVTVPLSGNISKGHLARVNKAYVQDRAHDELSETIRFVGACGEKRQGILGNPNGERSTKHSKI